MFKILILKCNALIFFINFLESLNIYLFQFLHKFTQKRIIREFNIIKIDRPASLKKQQYCVVIDMP